jgi:hypothetical protein
MKTLKNLSDLVSVSDFISLSLHAEERLAQRGISETALDVAFQFGEEFEQKDHSTAYYFSRANYEKLQLDEDMKKELYKFIGTTLIMSEDGAIITSFKNKNLKNITKRFKRKKYS